MTQFPDLPPAPRRHRPVPPGGLEAAVAAGRGRRQRAMAGASGATLVVALIALTTLGTSPTQQESLRVADPPPPAAGATQPADSEPPLGPALPPSPPAAGPLLPGQGEPPSTGAAPSRAPAAPGLAGRPPSGDQDRDGGAGAGIRPASRPAYREDTDENAPGSVGCTPSRTLPGRACTYASGSPVAEVVRRGDVVQVKYGECTSADDIGDRVYGFSGGQEKEVVAVREDGVGEVFRFSSTVRYVEGPHERRLQPGRCIEWTGRWDLTTTDGRPVPAGEYQLTLTVAPDRYEYRNAPDGVDEDPEPMVAQVRVRLMD